MEHLNYRTYNRETDTESYKFPSTLPLRPGINTTGKAIEIRVNQFKVAQWPTKDVYQYDVSFDLNVQTLRARPDMNLDFDWQWCREEGQGNGCLEVQYSPESHQEAHRWHALALGWQQAGLVKFHLSSST